MSSELVGTEIPLKRVDPGEVALQVRREMLKGGVVHLVVDTAQQVLYVERPEEFQLQLDLREQSKEAVGEAVDPVAIAMQEDLDELNCEGKNLREVMFLAQEFAAMGGGHVVFWGCGNLDVVQRLGQFTKPLRRSEKWTVAHGEMVESQELTPGQMVACISSVTDATPIEVEGGILIRLEDVQNAQNRRDADRSRDRAETGRRAVVGEGLDLGDDTPPTWFGPPSS